MIVPKGVGGLTFCLFGGALKGYFKPTGNLDEVFRIIHEAGHCMHSLLLYSKGFLWSLPDCLITETVARCNEHLLWYELCRINTDLRARAYLCFKILENRFHELFTYSVYAELELFWHDTIERGERLSPSSVQEKFCELHRFYGGNGILIETDVLWKSWIGGEFFLTAPFEAFNRALQIAASVAFAERIVHGGKKERDDYLAMLKTDPMLGPISIMSRGGLDLTSLSWIDTVMNTFDQHMDVLEKYLKDGLPMANLQQTPPLQPK